jgi:PAS domain S-box-containing protein
MPGTCPSTIPFATFLPVESSPEVRTTEKILLLFLPTFMLSVVLTALLGRRVVEAVLLEDAARSGRAIGFSLVRRPSLIDALRQADESRLRRALQEGQDAAGSAYATLLAQDGRVLAHTDTDGAGQLFDDETVRLALQAPDSRQWQREAAGRPLLDVSYPLWRVDLAGGEALDLAPGEGEGGHRLATLLVALPLDAPLAAAERISTQLLWVVTIINVLAMGLALFYVRRVLQPVQEMASATERMAAGELGLRVPVTSRDEVGDLAHSFNRMSQELARTTVSVDFLDSILDNMRDILVVTNADGSVRRINRAALGLLHYAEGDVIGRSASRLFAADAASLFSTEGVLGLTREGGTRARETRMLPRQGDPIDVLVSVAPFPDRAGTTAGFIVTAADITERKRAEERIRASLEEKEVLLKEIHHRVKNNLQIISSLLNLQSGTVADPAMLTLMTDSQNRVQSMSLIHEKLYQSDDLARVDLADYLYSLVMTVYQAFLRTAPDSVRVDVDIAEGIRLGIDQAIPCGLIVNELVSNALKHAYPEGEGEVRVIVQRESGQLCRLIVEDDGVGLPPATDPHTSPSLGLKLVSLLMRQLHGDLEVATPRTAGGRGTRFELAFRVSDTAAGGAVATA